MNSKLLFAAMFRLICLSDIHYYSAELRCTILVILWVMSLIFVHLRRFCFLLHVVCVFSHPYRQTALLSITFVFSLLAS